MVSLPVVGVSISKNVSRIRLRLLLIAFSNLGTFVLKLQFQSVARTLSVLLLAIVAFVTIVSLYSQHLYFG